MHIPLLHYPEYFGPTSRIHTTFTTQGPNILNSVKMEYNAIFGFHGRKQSRGKSVVISKNMSVTDF